MIWLLSGLSSVACAGEPSDVWMHLEQSNGDDQVVLHLPANWLAEQDDATVKTPDGPVDLAAEVTRLRGKRAGASRTVTVVEDDGDTYPLVFTATDDPAGSTSQLGIGIVGPKGNGLTMTVPLSDPDAARGALDGNLDVNGIPVSVDEPFLAQLRATGPVVLVRTTGKSGGGLKIETQ